MTYDRTAAWLRARLGFAAALGAVVWLTWLGSVAVGGGLYDAGGQLLGADHLAFYSAARLWSAGDMVRMYDLEFLQAYQRGLVGERWGDRLELMRNPPHYALLFVPVCGLAYAASFWVCAAVYVAAAVGVGRCFAPLPLRERAARLCGPGEGTSSCPVALPEKTEDASPLPTPQSRGGPPPQRGEGNKPPPLSLLWPLTFYPVFAAVSYGQNGTLSLFVFALVWRAVAAGRPFAAGLAAGLLLYKPQLLGGLLLWWLLEAKAYRAAWAGFALMCALTAAVSCALMPDATWYYVTEFATIAGYRDSTPWNMHNPRAFWGMLLPNHPHLALALTAVSSLAGVAAFVWLWRTRRDEPAAVFAAAVFLTVWVSPHTPLYDWSVVVAAAVVLWTYYPERRAVWLTLFAAAWLALAVSTPLAKWQVEHLPAAVQLSVPVLGAVGWLAVRALADLRTPDEPTPSA